MTAPMRLLAAHPFFHSVEKSFPQCGKNFHCVEKSRAASKRIRVPLNRCPQDVAVEDFFWILAGFHAKITGGFFDDGAVRTTRAGLVSASGRPRRASAEKMPVGFRAAKIQKKSSSLPRQPHLATSAP